MEDKKGKKVSISTILLIVAIIVIAVMGVFMYRLNKEKTTEVQKSTELQAEVDSLNEVVSDLQGKIDSISKTIGNEDDNTTTENSSSNQKWDGDITSVDMSKLKKDGVQYENLSSLDNSPNYVRFKNLNGVISIALDVDRVGGGFEKSELEKLGYTGEDFDGFSNYIELKNVSGIKYVGCGSFGQDFWKDSKVLFLTNDGIVKYETFENVVKNNISLKSVDKLNKIAKLYSCSIADVVDGQRMGGAMTTIAVDENGIAYDLNDYMN